METENTEVKNYFVYMVISECICVLIVLLSFFVIKFFFVKQYNELLKWYNENICVDTDVNEVLEIGGEEDETEIIRN